MANKTRKDKKALNNTGNGRKRYQAAGKKNRDCLLKSHFSKRNLGRVALFVLANVREPSAGQTMRTKLQGFNEQGGNEHGI